MDILLTAHVNIGWHNNVKTPYIWKFCCMKFLQISQMINQQQKFDTQKFTTLHQFQLKTGFTLNHPRNLSMKILINDSCAKYAYRENFQLYGTFYCILVSIIIVNYMGCFLIWVICVAFGSTLFYRLFSEWLYGNKQWHDHKFLQLTCHFWGQKSVNQLK